MSLYLVTGGAGFIGSHLCEELVRRGHRVRVVDNLITGKRRNLAHLPAVEFQEGDLADRQSAPALLRASTTCCIRPRFPRFPDRSTIRSRPIAPTSTAPSTSSWPPATRASNALFTPVPRQRTANTPTLPKREDMTPNPLSPYALQKLVAEQYCQMFTRLYGFETVAIRYFNVFGPRQDPGSPYSVSSRCFLPRRSKGRQPTIYGDGEQTRDFTYVANVVDGVLRACDAPGAVGEVINVATGGRISLNDLWQTIARIVGTAITPIYAETRAGDVKDSQADITKARNLLGYTPTVPLEEGLKKTLEWARSEIR